MIKLFAICASCLLPLSAATLTYDGVFAPVNGSGVTGTVVLTLTDNLLTVQINATGLEANEIHPMHIHGRLDANGNPLPPLTPQDLDGDGFIETPEAEQFVGPVLLPLDSPPGSGNFPTAPNGTINFTQTYTLSSSLLNELMPLNFRVVEIHGMTVGAQGAGTPFEVNGVPGYKAELPVASAMLTATPEPGSLVLLGAGLCGLAVKIRRTRR